MKGLLDVHGLVGWFWDSIFLPSIACHTSSYVREAFKEPCLRKMQFAFLRVQAVFKLEIFETA